MSPTPIWNRNCRELRLGKTLLKCFRQRARNQEEVLAAFQEEGWPPRIDDPLPGDDNRDGPERLRDTVKKLNRQKVRKIHFSCDGTGEGILWNIIKTKRPRSGPAAA